MCTKCPLGTDFSHFCPGFSVLSNHKVLRTEKMSFPAPPQLE